MRKIAIFITKLHADINNSDLPGVPMKWLCTICGYIHEGDEPPEVCPVCGATSDKFIKLEE